MKKAITLILAAILVFSLFVGLGRTDFTVETLTPAPLTGEKAEDAAETKGNSLSRGTWDGNEFTNSWSDVSFTCPDGWVISSDEDIADLMGVMSEILDEKTINAAKLVSIYDFMVQEPETGDNIILMYENLLLERALDITVDSYADLVEAQVTDTYGPMGVQCTFGERETVELAGEEYLHFPIDINGAITQYYYLRRVGNFMAAILATNISGYDREDFEAMFN